MLALKTETLLFVLTESASSASYALQFYSNPTQAVAFVTLLLPMQPIGCMSCWVDTVRVLPCQDAVTMQQGWSVVIIFVH